MLPPAANTSPFTHRDAFGYHMREIFRVFAATSFSRPPLRGNPALPAPSNLARSSPSKLTVEFPEKRMHFPVEGAILIAESARKLFAGVP